MATIHMTEAELARDLHRVLNRVRKGVEVVVEQDSRPVALIKTPPPVGRGLAECIEIALAEERHFAEAPSPDGAFAADVRAAVDAHDDPAEPTVWD